jgi:hypothetical protein
MLDDVVRSEGINPKDFSHERFGKKVRRCIRIDEFWQKGISAGIAIKAGNDFFKGPE